jgi:hypothetical protein
MLLLNLDFIDWKMLNDYTLNHTNLVATQLGLGYV